VGERVVGHDGLSINYLSRTIKCVKRCLIMFTCTAKSDIVAVSRATN